MLAFLILLQLKECGKYQSAFREVADTTVMVFLLSVCISMLASVS